MSTRQLLVSTLTVLGLGITVAQAGDLTPRQLYERDSPAVVMVMGHSNDGGQGSGGTGSIIQQDGLVLTNAHVILEKRTGRPYPGLSVYLKPDRVTGDPKVDLSRGAKATVVAFSEPLDLALLKLEGARGPLPVLELSDAEHTQIGDRVVAIGHPEQGGLWTLTTGVISADLENFNGIKGKNVFQTETGLNRGNSGGPLIDTDGRMIGINTAIARVANDGLPITSISFSLKSTVATKWLGEQGVMGQQARSLRDSLPSEKASARPAQTTAANQPTSPPGPISPSGPSGPPLTAPAVQPRPHVEPAPRPYNLDQVISERSRTEAELEDMIKDMRH